MISIQCDNCERTFDADPTSPGGKMRCPFCGDVNRLPQRDADSAPREDEAPAESGPAPGLPPDSGPEQSICTIHPAMFRAHPFRGLSLTLLLAGGAVLGAWAATAETAPRWLAWIGLTAMVIAFLWWLVWYLGTHLWIVLEVSNKRTVRREGIVRRHTSEVLHDHVRNVEIRQGFLGRIFNVGYLGISSSGQEGIEIEIRDIPRPYELKAIIDQYRNM